MPPGFSYHGKKVVCVWVCTAWVSTGSTCLAIYLMIYLFIYMYFLVFFFLLTICWLDGLPSALCFIVNRLEKVLSVGTPADSPPRRCVISSFHLTSVNWNVGLQSHSHHPFPIDVAYTINVIQCDENYFDVPGLPVDMWWRILSTFRSRCWDRRSCFNGGKLSPNPWKKITFSRSIEELIWRLTFRWPNVKRINGNTFFGVVF